MIETILLMPGNDGNELVRTLARKGMNTLGTRVMTCEELADFALASNSMRPDGRIINNGERTAIVHSFAGEIDYFNPLSYSDSEQIAASINQMRMMIEENEKETIHDALSAGTFAAKNQAVMLAYDRYCQTLHDNELIDGAGLMRQAIEAGVKIDRSRYQVITFEEYPLMPLERTLIRAVTDGEYTEDSLMAFMGYEPAPLKVDRYTEAYGAINEIRDIFADIIDRKIPYDSCLIAVADGSAYSRIICEAAQEYGIDVTLGCGVPIAVSKPAALLRLYRFWKEGGWQGVDALRNMVCDGCFTTDKLCNELECDHGQLMEIIKVAGNLRLGTDAFVNERRLAEYSDLNEEHVPKVRKLSQILQLPLADFVREYARIDEGARADAAASEAICSRAETYARITGSDPVEIIDEILQMTVCRQQSRGGAIHVTTINAAPLSMRDNLYVCGLDSSAFPGNPRENYILLDSDLELLCDEPMTSTKKIEVKKEQLRNLINIASAAGTRICISYSNYDPANLKELNPSSSVYEIYRRHRGESMTAEDFRNELGRSGFFDRCFNKSDVIARKHMDGIKADFTVPKSMVRLEEKKGFSPSAIGEFFRCGVMFMIKRMAGVYLEEADNPLQVISAADIGTLAHQAMENLAGGFGDTSAELFDSFVKKRPPVNRQAAANARRDFMEMMTKAMADDPGNQVIMAEEELAADCFGVKIHGRPDRIEMTSEGDCIIVDYKTGRNVTHEKDDIQTCLQIVLYAYMAEACGYEIKRGEFRYLRNSTTVTCRYDDSMKEELEKTMETFRTSIAKGEYRYAQSKEACRYCLYGHICGKEGIR